MGDVILDAFIDTLKVLPFLLIMNFVIELIEYRSQGLKANKILKGGFAPLIGAAVGIVPQCGFSVVATELYGKRRIALGTLLAVYLATSDEALPIMLSSPQGLAKIAPIIIIKVCFALIVGYAVFGVETLMSVTSEKKRKKSAARATDEHMRISANEKNSIDTASDSDACAREHASVAQDSTKNADFVHEEHAEDHGGEEYADGEHDHDGACENDDAAMHIHGCHRHALEESDTLPENASRSQRAARFWRTYLKHPILHTATVIAFILAVNVIFGVIVYYVGEDSLAEFVTSTGYFQSLLSGLVGLIPNCAASVVITELYVVGGINLGGALSGLCVSAGIGYAVLAKQNRPVKNTVLVIALAYVLSVALGLCVTALGY